MSQEQIVEVNQSKPAFLVSFPIIHPTDEQLKSYSFALSKNMLSAKGWEGKNNNQFAPENQDGTYYLAKLHKGKIIIYTDTKCFTMQHKFEHIYKNLITNENLTFKVLREQTMQEIGTKKRRIQPIYLTDSKSKKKDQPAPEMLTLPSLVNQNCLLPTDINEMELPEIRTEKENDFATFLQQNETQNTRQPRKISTDILDQLSNKNESLRKYLLDNFLTPINKQDQRYQRFAKTQQQINKILLHILAMTLKIWNKPKVPALADLLKIPMNKLQNVIKQLKKLK